jgi:pimeloyl-ACP methyl ester carboxylesterase
MKRNTAFEQWNVAKMRMLILALIAFSAMPCNSQTVDSTLYLESPIALHTSTGTIFGTLCVPSHAKRFPVALIIAGSGPTDRDGNSMAGENCDAYKILAHRLAVNNIASLRYDKRGVGESMAAVRSESDIRFDNYVDDAHAWIDTLKKSQRYTQVIVIGHSEGSLIGMIAAKNADKYISIAGAGTKAGIDMKRQFAASLPEGLKDTADVILDSLADGHVVSHVPPKLKMLFRKSVQPYMISWLKYDPQMEIRKLHIPVLIIQGANDVQVDTSDAKLLAAADPKVTLLLIKNMNHVLRITTGDRAENIKTYNEPDLPISDTLVNEISEFINAR